MKNKFLKKVFALIIFLVVLFITVFGNIAYADTKQYYIKVNYEANVVTVYERNGNSLNPIKAMVCSCGSATPRGGSYRLNYKYRWLALFGGVYGQYCSRIVGNILFHSVPYTRNGDESSLEFWEYDKLGTFASMGCIRLKIEDAKWIYDNCDNRTIVEFYASSDPGPLGKPNFFKISDMFEDLRGWDPTDPSGNNPWNNFYDIAFDSRYYADNNIDLKNAFGYDENKLKIHWYNNGIKEGRQASSNFNVRYYLENNEDLRNSLGNNYMAAYKHYIKSGCYESRKATANLDLEIYRAFNNDLKNMSNYDLTNHYKNCGYKEGRISNISKDKIQLIFNYKDYAELNPDLKKAFGYNETALYSHWLNCGIKEGRQASKIFDVKYYLNNNTDLKRAFGNDYKRAYLHFVQNGINEERRATRNFDVNVYRINEDLKNMSNYDLNLHYENFGKNEGRIASIDEKIENIIFDSKFYADKYPDLKQAFGYDYNRLKKHFYQCGIKEERQASRVFDVNYYLNTNEDLKRCFVNNKVNALVHFMNSGIKEGRNTSNEFNIKVYRENNEDLNRAFGNNYEKYYLHYIDIGYKEGRKSI